MQSHTPRHTWQENSSTGIRDRSDHILGALSRIMSIRSSSWRAGIRLLQASVEVRMCVPLKYLQNTPLQSGSTLASCCLYTVTEIVGDHWTSEAQPITGCHPPHRVRLEAKRSGRCQLPQHRWPPPTRSRGPTAGGSHTALHARRSHGERHFSDNAHSELGSTFRNAWMTSGSSDLTMYR